MFGLTDWERLPVESREMIMNKIDNLAGLIRKEYDSKNREKEWIRSPLIVIDAEGISILPKEMIAEQKRVWELKKAKMGKPH